jgi:hypothetical protein
MAPVWEALPEETCGTFYVSPPATERARFLSVRNLAKTPIPVDKTRPMLAAASGDMFSARRAGRRVVLMEHGAGQSYGGLGEGSFEAAAGRHSSYAGGDSRDVVAMFLHPGPHPAARDSARYPKARVEIVGCPKLDVLPSHEPDGEGPVVALSFHWDCNVVRETRSSFIWLRQHIVPAMKKGGIRFIGHGHPRIIERIRPWYVKHGIETVSSVDEVFRRADAYVCDNSSTLFEFAHTGRPVVVLNPPFYRRSVNHGVRFWDAATVGVQLDEPSLLREAIEEALRNTQDHQAARDEALTHVYAYRSGAAGRAASAIMDFLS